MDLKIQLGSPSSEIDSIQNPPQKNKKRKKTPKKQKFEEKERQQVKNNQSKFFDQNDHS